MRNDFFKYVLLSGGSRQNHTEIESDTQPVTFKGNGHRLRNYRIYGNDGGVGDLKENEKYILPVTVQGKNWYNINQYSLTEGQVIYGATGQLVTNPSYSATVDYIPCTDISGNKMILNKSPGKYAPGIAFYDADKKFISGVINNSQAVGTPITFDVPENAVFMRFSVPVNETEIQIEYGSVATAYEPYHEPQTVNITLDAPLTADEYVDFRTQKRYPSGDIAELSPLPTIDGTNIITVDTETAPSKVYVQGNISSVETVENVQTNTLQSQLLNISALDLTDEPQTVQEQGGEDSGYTDT